MAVYTIQNRLSEITWRDLAPGDVVEIPYRPEPYRELVVITTQAAPNSLVVRGIPGPNGEQPTLSGENAVADPQFQLYKDFPEYETFGLVKLWHLEGMAWDWMVSNIVLENLRITGVKTGNSFTSWDGSTKQWKGSYAIYAHTFDGLTLRNCVIEDVDGGVFCKDGVGSKNVLMEGNRLRQYGVVGSDQIHGSYVQVIGATYRNNVWEGPRAGSIAGSLKDRSANALVEGNVVHAGARCVDFSAFDGDAARLAADKGAIVRNNLLLNVDGAADSCVFSEGGRNPNSTIQVTNNTIVYRVDQSKKWSVSPCIGWYDPTLTFAIAGNIIDVAPLTAVGAAPKLNLAPTAGTFAYGPNWTRGDIITGGWQATPIVTGLDQVVKSTVPPGFTDEANGDYSLVAGAPATGYGYTATAPPPSPPPPPPPPAPTWAELTRFTATTASDDGNYRETVIRVIEKKG